MSSPENEFSFNSFTSMATSPTSKALNNQEVCFQDISLCSSNPICRICHCSGEEEQLIEPCRCSGSVRFAHQTCLRTWIVGSAISSCELCSYKFRTESKRIKDFRKLHFPRPSFKGWLHISLFLAFFSILLTSLTWVLWSQISTSKAAKAERTSKEIYYAYALNGGFIVMALIGLYLDSFTQCRSYYRRWSLMNQHLIILSYDSKEDVDNKPLTSLSPVNSSTPISEFSQRTRSITTQNNRAFLDGITSSDTMQPSLSRLQSIHSSPEANVGAACVHRSITATSRELLGPSEQQDFLQESRSASSDLQRCATLRETYV